MGTRVLGRNASNSRASRLQLQRQGIIKGEGRFALGLHPPAKLQVFCEDDTWLRQTAEEAMADMKDRTGHQRDFAEGELGKSSCPAQPGGWWEGPGRGGG